MTRSEDIKELATALSKAQGEFLSPEKNATNPYGRGGKPYNYTDLSEFINCTRKALSENELSIVQLPKIEKNIISVETILFHGSGQWISNLLEFEYEKGEKAMPKIQEMGGTITYLRKYGFSAIVNITGGDDDNDGADIKEPINGKQQEKQKTQTKKEESKKTYTAPSPAPPVKTEEPKKEIDPRVKPLWERSIKFHAKEEMKKIFKEKWNVESTSQLSDQQLIEWAGWINNLEIQKLAREQMGKEQKEKETATAPASISAPASARSDTETTTGAPWTIARPDQVNQIEKLLTELNWTKERKVEWWEKYRKTHKIETSTFPELTNTQASSLIVYLENKLREKKLEDSLSSPPPPISDVTEEEARKINEENLKLALEDKVPF